MTTTKYGDWNLAATPLYFSLTLNLECASAIKINFSFKSATKQAVNIVLPPKNGLISSVSHVLLPKSGKVTVVNVLRAKNGTERPANVQAKDNGTERHVYALLLRFGMDLFVPVLQLRSGKTTNAFAPSLKYGLAIPAVSVSKCARGEIVHVLTTKLRRVTHVYVLLDYTKTVEGFANHAKEIGHADLESASSATKQLRSMILEQNLASATQKLPSVIIKEPAKNVRVLENGILLLNHVNATLYLSGRPKNKNVSA